MDFRICQTSTASPAQPGGLPTELGRERAWAISVGSASASFFPELQYSESKWVNTSILVALFRSRFNSLTV